MPDAEVKVVTHDLRTKAAEIKDIQFTNVLDNAIVIPPDQLTLSKTAVDNLDQNASFLYRYQEYGHREGDRLAETLNSVAEAYDLVDAFAAGNINGVNEPQLPKTNTIPAPTIPAPMGSPLALTADEIGDVEVAQKRLSLGDHGGSLREAAAQWMSTGNRLQTASQQFKIKFENWEGAAAEQAYAKFVAYGEWLSQLGESWQKLGGEAMRISDAHLKAFLNHTPVYQNYEQLKSQMIAAIANGGSAAHDLGQQMERLQHESEQIIDGYSKEAALQTITPPTPPPSGVPNVPVTSNGDPRHAGPNSSPQTAPGSAGGGGSGQAPSMPQTGASSARPGPAAAGAPSTGESSSKGVSGSGAGPPSGGGGSPTGSGSPSVPGEAATPDIPTLPHDPSVHPAAAEAGGAVGGGSGGGAGRSSIPLLPSVSSVSVGPGPAGAGGAGGTPTAVGVGGATGGGAGGGHGGQAQGGKEKRRTPGLAPDEALYAEDRTYTEEVIGARKRRTVQDPKDSM